MTPGSFDPTTAREMVGDQRAREIEAKARRDADEGVFTPPAPAAALGTYWAACQETFERVVYAEQHARRLKRLARLAAP